MNKVNIKDSQNFITLYLSRKVDTKNIYFLICFSKVDMKVIF